MEDVAPAVLDMQGIGLGDVSAGKSSLGVGGSEGTNAALLRKKVSAVCFDECSCCFG